MAILNESGVNQGVIYLIPDSPSDVVVNVLGANAEVDGEDLLVNDVVIGVVNGQGQIALDTGYQLAFADLNDLNIYDPIHILDDTLNTVFTVSVSGEFGDVEFKVPTGPFSEFLSGICKENEVVVLFCPACIGWNA